MTGKKIGYARVSTPEQNPESQISSEKLDKLFIETKSGKDIDRPVLQEMLNYIRDDDMIYVQRMDRLARNIDDLRQLVKTINGKGASIRFIKEGLIFDGQDSPVSNLMLTVIGAFGEFERRIARERQLEGIEIAKAKGIYKGRKPSLSKDEFEKVKYMINDLGMSKAKVAREYGVSAQTIYAYLRGTSKPYKGR